MSGMGRKHTLDRKMNRTPSSGNKNARMSRGDITFEAVVVILLGIVALIIVYPLVYVISASFSDAVSVTAGKMVLWPVGLTLGNYEGVFKNASIMTGYRNSLFILFIGTAFNLVMTVLAAFPLSRRDLWGRNVLMKLITFTMFFSGGLIPVYLMVSKTLGLGNSWAALILPGSISVYNLIIMRTFFTTSIPYELQEAAQIDGASHIMTLLRIMLPLSGPILAVIALYYGVGHWNSYFSAMLYISQESKQPLQLFLRKVLIINSAQSLMDMGSDEAARQAMRAEVIKYAVIVLSSLPMLIIYPFVQRFFVKGVMVGSVKG